MTATMGHARVFSSSLHDGETNQENGVYEEHLTFYQSLEDARKINVLRTNKFSNELHTEVSVAFNVPSSVQSKN